MPHNHFKNVVVAVIGGEGFHTKAEFRHEANKFSSDAQREPAAVELALCEEVDATGGWVDKVAATVCGGCAVEDADVQFMKYARTAEYLEIRVNLVCIAMIVNDEKTGCGRGIKNETWAVAECQVRGGIVIAIASLHVRPDPIQRAHKATDDKDLVKLLRTTACKEGWSGNADTPENILNFRAQLRSHRLQAPLATKALQKISGATGPSLGEKAGKFSAKFQTLPTERSVCHVNVYVCAD